MGTKIGLISSFFIAEYSVVFARNFREFFARKQHRFFPVFMLNFELIFSSEIEIFL